MSAPAQDEHAYLSSLLSNITTRLRVLEGGGSSSGSSASTTPSLPPSTQAQETPKSLRAYESYLQATLIPFLEAATALGGQAVELGAVVKGAWDAQRDFLVMAAAVKPPANDTQIISKLAPVQAAIQKVQKMIQRNEFENHAKAVAEGMQALTWVVVRPAPCEYIENFIGAADFWGNKVRIQHKRTAPEHVLFVDAYKKVVVELMSYVKECHLTGVSWNPQGVDIESYVPGSSSTSSSSSSSTTTAATPAAPAAPVVAAAEPAGGGRAGLFSQLGKGLLITSGLKKVSKDQQTWRPEFNKDAAAPPPPPSVPSSSSSSSSSPFSSSSKAVQQKPPSSSYDPSQFRWNVQHYTDPSLPPSPITIEDKKQSVYIYNCGACVIEIKGKGKSVTLDGCKKTQVVIDEMLSSLEVVNCQGVKVQVRQHVPTVAIDKTDGIVVLLSKEGLGTSFITSKSSEMNIQYPKNEEGELTETPIPEQWQHSLEGEWPKMRVKNEVSALYTH